MVSKIIISQSIEKALNYNENKLQNGKADCIHAGNFLKDADQMNFYDKLNRFADLIVLNDRATTNTLHISLNFDPSENLSREELSKIATAYMEKIGFGEQPYLVYEHHDAGHPHVHLVTTNIRNDGSRINTHNIGRNQSEKARKEIEQEFGLVRAEGSNSRGRQGIEPVNPEKVIYGKSETKRSVTNVLDAVINLYKYTSLAELNAVLKQYNVLADRGHEEGRIYKTGGLVYRVLDAQGNKVGVPIKASSIHSKPTLNYLQKKFTENEEKRKSSRQPVRDKINLALEKSESLQQFIRELNKMGIVTALRQNDKDFIYGVTFIDHNTKSVFNGSDLGKTFSAAAIQQRITSPQNNQQEISPISKPVLNAEVFPKEVKESKEIELNTPGEKVIQLDKSPKSNDLLEELIQPEKSAGNVPYELRKKKRKKKRRNNKL